MTKTTTILLRFIVPYLLIALAMCAYLFALGFAGAICNNYHGVSGGGGDMCIGSVLLALLVIIIAIVILFICYLLLVLEWQLKRIIIKSRYRYGFYFLFAIGLSVALCMCYMSFEIWAPVTLAALPLLQLIAVDIGIIRFFRFVDNKSHLTSR